MTTPDYSQVPTGAGETSNSLATTDMGRHSGIGRGAFAIIVVSIVCLTEFLNWWSVTRDHGLSSLACSWIFLVVLAVVGVLPRAINMGMHPAKVLLTFIPIANLILFLRCLIYQGGYEPRRKVDRTGKIIALIIAIFWILGYSWLILDGLGMI